MQELKIDKIDKKLLGYIFHNFRTPITQIAKKCRISREQAEYRIKKYEKSGLINKYLSGINLHALGYNKNYIIKLRVKNPQIKKLAEINNLDNLLVFTRVYCYGQWDYMISIFAKDKTNILEFISYLYELWKHELLNYEILEPIEMHYFPLKIFGKTEHDKTLSYAESKKIVLDDLDKKILSVLAENANIKIVELAHKVNSKIETINYRLKRIEKNMILGYRIFLNLDVIGYNLTLINVKMNNLSKSFQNKLLTYAKQRDRVHAFSLNVGKFNTIFQIIYKHPEELKKEINKIKETFAENLIEYELVNIEKELNPKMLPDVS